MIPRSQHRYVHGGSAYDTITSLRRAIAAKDSNFEIFESTLYLKSRSIPLIKLSKTISMVGVDKKCYLGKFNDILESCQNGSDLMTF